MRGLAVLVGVLVVPLEVELSTVEELPADDEVEAEGPT